MSKKNEVSYSIFKGSIRVDFNCQKAVMDIEEAKEQVEKLKGMIEKAENYVPDTFDQVLELKEIFNSKSIKSLTVSRTKARRGRNDYYAMKYLENNINKLKEINELTRKLINNYNNNHDFIENARKQAEELAEEKEKSKKKRVRPKYELKYEEEEDEDFDLDEDEVKREKEKSKKKRFRPNWPYD